MKKITLAEAATRVVMNLPQEDLHEGYGHRDMQKVVSYLEGFLKNADSVDKAEAEKWSELCSDEIESNESNTDWYSYSQSMVHLQWAVLYNATSAISRARQRSEPIVKKDLAILKSLIKVKV